MYLILFLNKKTTRKCSVILLLILLPFAFYSQTKYESVYAREFKQVKKTPYNVKLISFSEVKPEKNWKNYQGGPINTEDSLFFYNNNQLCFSFPTNSNTHRNSFLIFYFSQKSA